MFRPLFIALALVLICSGPALSVSLETEAPTQRDLIVGLVESLGWSFGLPDDPVIEDYLAILNGHRVFRYEAEDIYTPNDDAPPIIPKEILTFGPFSGKAWQRAPAEPITVELRFRLPLPGRYRFSASLIDPGYVLHIGGTTLSADGADTFSEVTFGEVDLSEGPQTATLEVPARGGLDYFVISAPPAAPIEPPGGWRPDEPLDAAVMAAVMARVLALEDYLPPAEGAVVIEAESAPAPRDSTFSDDRYQGPASGEWLLAGMRTAYYSNIFELKRAGIYAVSLNALGRSPIEGVINERFHFNVDPAPYFEEIAAGSFPFEQGLNQIDIRLPSRAGFDRLVLTPRRSGPGDFIRLAGLSPDTTVTNRTLDDMLQLMAIIGARR